jgi:DNA-binding GntR family transcriptional regulator
MDRPTPTAVLGKSVAAYEQLKELAIRGGLRPGRRLTPPQVAEVFGVSHTPVREALARLAAEGFVSWRMGQGYYAKTYTALEQGQLLEVGLGLLATSMGAARRRQPAALLEPLTRLAPPSIGDPGDAARLAGAVEALHAGMAHATGNMELARLSRLVAERTALVRLIDLGEHATAEMTVMAIGAIAKALLCDDLEAAQRLGREMVRARQARMDRLVALANHQASAARFP